MGISIQISPPTASVLLRNYPELPGTPWNYLLLKPGTTLHVDQESLVLVAKVDKDVDGVRGPKAPPGHQGKGQLGYRGPLWDPMEPCFPTPVPSPITRANFNLVSRPPESVCLITQVEIQGVDLLLGCRLGDTEVT